VVQSHRFTNSQRSRRVSSRAVEESEQGAAEPLHLQTKAQVSLLQATLFGSANSLRHHLSISHGVGDLT